MSEEIKIEVKSKVQELFKKIERKKELETELATIKTELAEYGIEETEETKPEAPSKPLPTEKDIEKIITFLNGKTKKLADVANHIGCHALAVKKFLNENGFKVAKKDKLSPAIVSYIGK